MRKYSFLLFLSLIVSGSLGAQLVNNGGVITIQPNAKLVVQSDITNTTGSIVNSGTIEVEGDFTNAATVTSNSGSKLVFKGDSDSNFDSGGAVFTEVENNKTAGNVVLTSAASVTEAVNFSGSSDILLGNYDFQIADGASSNGSASGHFVTDGTGFLIQKTDAAGTNELDLGDGTNFSPISIAHTGTYTAGTSEVKAQVDNTEHPDKLTDADDYLNRYWTVENNIGTPSLAMTGTYVAGDVQGTAGDMVGARYEAMDWEFGTGAQSGSTVSATTTEASSELTGMNFYGKANVKVWLEGAYNSSNDNMNTSINSLVPTSSPYSDGASHSLSSFPTDIVDWIEVEYIDGGSSIKKSAFLKSDGTIVDLDGSSPVLLKDAPQNALMNIYHRNHLPIGTASTVDMLNSSGVPYDATLLANIYNDINLSTDNAVELEPGVYGMFRGNGSGDNQLNFIDYLQVRTNSNPSQSNVYSIYDINLDSSLNFIDYILARTNASVSKSAHLN